jgi:hypothetical protein
MNIVSLNAVFMQNLPRCSTKPIANPIKIPEITKPNEMPPIMIPPEENFP